MTVFYFREVLELEGKYLSTLTERECVLLNEVFQTGRKHNMLVLLKYYPKKKDWSITIKRDIKW